jgi:hypothetical protein
MRSTAAPVLLLAIVASTAASCGRPADAEPTSHPARRPARLADIVLARDSEILRALVPQRTTMASLLETHKLLAHEVVALVTSVGQKFDLRRLRAGQPYRLDRYLDGRVREFECSTPSWRSFPRTWSR